MNNVINNCNRCPLGGASVLFVAFYDRSDRGTRLLQVLVTQDHPGITRGGGVGQNILLSMSVGLRDTTLSLS